MKLIFIFCFFLITLNSTYGQLDSMKVDHASQSVSEFNYLHFDELVLGKFAGAWVTPVSYTHLTLPTNREV